MTDGAVQRSAAVRWLPTEPFAHFDDIHRRMNQLMRQHPGAAARQGWWVPAVDVEETDVEFVIEIELPGATAHDVVVEWNDRLLTVRGQIPARERVGVLCQHARRTGMIHHTIALPGPVLGNRLTASMTAGVLTIRAPKAHPGPPHRILIVDPDAPPGQKP
jgi:HSP20 family protein